MINIPIFLSSDNNYAPFIATTIASICDNTEQFCEFYVLDGGISKENKAKICELKNRFNNFSIEFVYIDKEKYFKKFITNSYITVATYYRIVIPKLYPNIQKFLYLDVDIIVKGNISQLFNEKLDDYIIGAAEDTGNKYFIKNLKYKIGVEQKHIYFNAGILIINSKKWNEQNVTEELFKIEEKYRGNLECNDQDMLNKYFENNYKLLPHKYNSKQIEDDTIIRHYYHPVKPWQIPPDSKLGKNILPDLDIFWKYAKMTPFYNELLENCKYDTNHKLQLCLILKKFEEQKKVKVSIIIPVYNTEKYLPQCLDTVTHQSLVDIEIICVNDGSTDNSLNILQTYARDDDRIKIIDLKENKGAAIARNKGIEEAKGEYIGFVDSDDYPDLDFYKKLYNKAIETNADCAKGNYRYTKTNTIPDYLNKKIIEDKNNFSFAFCSAIFKKSVLAENNIKFPEMCDMEDPIFTYKFALKANRVEIVDTYINITTREDSQTIQPVSMQRVKSRISGLKTIVDLVNSSNISKESNSFICAFWTWSIFSHSLKAQDKNISAYLINSIFDLTEKIKYLDLYYNELYKLNPFFLDRLKHKDIEQLLNFNKYYFLYLVKNKMKEKN